jgi:hypothetical protein
VREACDSRRFERSAAAGAPNAQHRPRQRFESFRGNRASAVIAEAVGLLGQFDLGSADVSEHRLYLVVSSDIDESIHRHACAIADALAERDGFRDIGWSRNARKLGLQAGSFVLEDFGYGVHPAIIAGTARPLCCRYLEPCGPTAYVLDRSTLMLIDLHNSNLGTPVTIGANMVSNLTLPSLAAVLMACDRWAGRYRNRYRARPLRDKLEAGEHLAFGHAVAGMIVAEDHMAALARLVHPQFNNPFAAQTISRASIEASARVWYLMDPAIDRQTRLSRWLTELVHETRELMKLRTIDENEILERLTVIARVANRFNLPVQRDRRGRATAIGSARPQSGALVGDLFTAVDPQHGRATYRWYSFSVHATFTAVTTQTTSSNSDSRDRILTMEPSRDDIVIAVSNVVWAWTFAHERLVVQANWDMSEWQSWKTQILQSVDLIRKREWSD